MRFEYSLFILLWSAVIEAGGWLQINSAPANAAVYINGEYRGLTPKPPDHLKLNLVAGQHRLRLHWPQGKDYYQKIRITDGQSLALSIQQNSPPKPEIEPEQPVSSSSTIDHQSSATLIPLPRNF